MDAMTGLFLPVAVPLVPLFLALVFPGWVRAFPRTAAVISALAMGVGSLLLMMRVPGVGVERWGVEWVPSLGIDLAFRMDAFTAWFGALVLGIGGCVVLHAGGYLGHSRRFPGVLACFSSFTLAMLGVIFADNFYVLFLFWEATSLLSFLLVGYHHEEENVREKASQALLVTLTGGACLLAGLVMMHLHFGTASLSGLLDRAGSELVLSLPSWALVLFLIGAFTKSAQWPFHFWLPNAMVGPAPVSAFLHSATMVKAGVFLLATLAPVLSSHPLWMPLVVGCGVLTVVTAVLRGAREDDLKALLASTTLAALGFLTVLAGIGTPAALLGFAIFLTAHALYKAPLFLAAGNFEKAFGTRRVGALAGAVRGAPMTGIAYVVSAVSLLGLAPMPGFLGKEYLLKATWAFSPVLALGLALAAAGVLGLGLRLLVSMLDGRRVPEVKKRVPMLMVVAALLPALGSVGLVISMAATEHQYLGAAAAALGAPAGAAFSFWHGWTPAFGLGVLALGVAVVVWRVLSRPGVEPLPAAFAPIFEPVFDHLMVGIRKVGSGVSRVLQSGSSGFQIGLMLSVIGVVAVGGLNAALWGMPESKSWVGTEVWLILAPVIALAAAVAARAERTLTLLVSLGFVGLIVALLFLWFSAPDLALTQLLAETLLLFLLAGVLRKAGEKGEGSGFSIGRGIFALCGGLLVTFLVLKAMALEWDGPISDFHLTHSKTAAYGANVVNVILVDFRALDTLGEILVLAIAGLGVTAALGAARKRSVLPHDSGSAWLRLAARMIALVAVPISLMLFWRGHNEPGGGFIAALVAASGVGLLLLVGDAWAGVRILRRWALRLSVAGLVVAAGAAVLPMLMGEAFFKGLWLHWGDTHLGTPLVFDLGVYLTVLGFCMAYLRHFQPNRN